MKNKPAFPISANKDPDPETKQYYSHQMQSGMTLREYYIGQILASKRVGSNSAIAKSVIALADEVISQLEKDND